MRALFISTPESPKPKQPSPTKKPKITSHEHNTRHKPINNRDETGLCLLDIAVSEDQPDTIRWLIQEAGADPNNMDSKCRTPLYYALKWYRKGCVDALIECGAGGHLVTVDFIRINPPSWLHEVPGVNWFK